MAQNFSLWTILEKENKLTAKNFMNWFWNLKIVLKKEKTLHVLENEIPEEPTANAPRVEKDAYKKHSEDAVDVQCLMLASMEPDLQK